MASGIAPHRRNKEQAINNNEAVKPRLKENPFAVCDAFVTKTPSFTFPNANYVRLYFIDITIMWLWRTNPFVLSALSADECPGSEVRNLGCRFVCAISGLKLARFTDR
jgi:hypothetical protein